ncbi:hypothetical protein [Streptomyces sp. NPDC055099]
MDAVVMAAGTALVAAMATDAWQQVRDSVVGVWRRIHPEGTDPVRGDLETLRSQIVQARQMQDAVTEQALEGMWRLQLQALLQRDPRAAGELRRLMEGQLVPVLDAGERERVYSVFQHTAVSGGTSFVAGRDIGITGEPPAPKA